MIFKIQRPLSSTHMSPPALAYNRDRSLQFFVPFDDDLKARIGDRSKMYVEADWHDESSTLDIGEEVEAQDW